MRKATIRSCLLYLALFPLGLSAQIYDCPIAQVICSDSTISFKPSGRGIDDFLNPNNDYGCLEERENISAWYYFEFRGDMPLNSVIEFSIKPLRGGKTDYDFAIFGPDLYCDSLGRPIRCSFADPNNLATAGDSTGLRPYVLRKNPLGTRTDTIWQTEFSEAKLADALGRPADGFVAPMVVQPRQGFYLLLDFFQRDYVDPEDFLRFQLKWGGSAAPYLNCIVNPRCVEAYADAGRDTTVCAGGRSFRLQGAAFNTNGGATYRWEATGNGLSFLSDPNVPQPIVTIPEGFSEDITYRLIVSEGRCVKEDSVRVRVLAGPQPIISGDTLLCAGTQGSLEVQDGFRSYAWEGGGSTRFFTVTRGGTYRVQVTDNNGCPGTADIEVREYPIPRPIINGPAGFCPGGQTTLQVTGPVFNSYRWSTGSTQPSITVNTPGSYRITVTTVDGCTAVDSIEVVQFSLPAPSLAQPDYFCAGGSVTLDPGAGFRQYRWSTGQTDPAIVVDRAGPYAVTVTDTNGCSAAVGVSVREAPNPQPSVSGKDTFCSTTTTLLSANSGYAGYRWSTGDTTPVISVSLPGQYRVTVTDALGCTGTAARTVDTLAVPRPAITGPSTLCSGDSIILSVNDGFTRYDWSNGRNSQNIVIFGGGTYRVTVTAPNGCEAADSLDVVRFVSPEPVITLPDYICEGSSATLDVGTQYRSYNWRSGETTPAISATTQGTYAVTVTDANGCSGRASAFLRVAPRPRPVIQGDSTFCSDGSTRLDVGGGYQRQEWSTGDTTRDIVVTNPGIYRVTVFDTLNCSAEALFRADTLPVPRPVITGPGSLCLGDTIQVEVDPGFARYQWSTGASQPALRIRNGGNFQVTVTNDVGCTAVRSVAIQAFDRRLPDVPERYGFCSGEQVTLNAGSGFTAYRWSDGSADSTLTVNRGGTYGLTVTDDNGCVSALQLPVDEHVIAEPQIRGQDEFCSGQRISLFVEGPYVDYQWSTGDTTATLSLNRGGAYSVTVTDGNGCTTSKVKEVLEKPSPVISIKGDTLYCQGDSTDLSVPQGYASYLWTTGQGTPVITVRQPGSYGVQVRADNGCITTDRVMVRDLAPPQPLLIPAVVYCPGDVATLDAGPEFSSYIWSDGSKERLLTTNNPGIYQVTVTDRYGCVGSAQTIVKQLPGPFPQIQSEQTFCSGTVATLRADANFPKFLWSTGDTTLTIQVTEPGKYRVTVTDRDGCQAGKTITLTEVQAPDFSLLGNDFFCSGSSTTLTVPEIYQSYQWSTGSTRRSITVRQPGEYSVQVTGFEGCAAEKMIAVREVALPKADAGDPAVLDCRRPQIAIGGATTSVGSNLDYRWAGPGIHSGNERQLTPVVTVGGTYTFQVVDRVHQCFSAVDTVVVDDIRITPRSVVQAMDTLDCRTTSVQLDASASDQGGSLVYGWSSGSGLPIPSDNPMRLEVTQPGLYIFAVRDTLSGCVGSASVLVAADRNPPPVDAGTTRQLDCRNNQIQLNASSTPTGSGLTFNWSTVDGHFIGQENTLFPLVDQPGTYVLTVENDRNGCLNTDSVLVTRNIEAPLASAGADQELDCEAPVVTLDASASRAVQGELRYQWARLDDPSFAGEGIRPAIDRPGIYVLLLTDNGNGCTDRDTVVVTRNENLPTAIQVQAARTTCYEDTDGRILITGVTGGEGPYLFRLNDGPFVSTESFENLRAGTYRLSVMDLRGCELTQPVEIGRGNDLKLNVGEDLRIHLGDSVTLQAIANIPPEEIDYFRWTRPDTLPNDTSMIIKVGPLRETIYEATVVDSNGCEAHDQLTIYIIQKARVYIPNAFSPNNDGHNDIFMVFSGGEVARIQYLRLFNRWGEMVFQNEDFPPNDPTFGWDGKVDGRWMNPQVFVYMVEVEYLNGKREMFKGDVTLIR